MTTRDEPTAADPPALVIALHRDRGWALIPVRDKRPMVDWKAYQEQRPSRTKMTVWQCQYEPSSWAVVTGAQSGVIALDFDGEQGLETLAALDFEPHVTTPSGGGHVHFEHPGVPVATRAPVDTERWPSMDVRGDGGLAIVWGRSSHGDYIWRDREPYEWSRLPHELADALTRKTTTATSIPRTGRRVPEGSRHSHLLSRAGKLAAAGMTADAIEAAVVAENAAACDPPMSEAEARRLATDVGRRYGDLRRYPLTDLGNAERLADLNADELRHVAGVGWHRYDGRCYRRDEGDVEVTRCASMAARSQYRELADEAGDDRSSRRKWAQQSESRRSLEAAISLAKTLPGIAISQSDLDADPYLFNVLNGTIDLRTGEPREHRRGDLISKVAGASYDPDARSARWDDFLAQVTGDDADLRRFLAQAVGYSLSGVASEEILFYVHGPGNTGKTSLIEAVKATFGDYASTASFATFTRSKFGGGIPTDIAALAGVRLAIASEVDEGQNFDVARIKQLTGGDTMRARFLYRNTFEFRPQLTLWFVANARPAANADDDAFWRRIRQIPFVRVIPERDRDPAVKQQLTQDPDVRSAILAWAVDGYRDWQENGFVVPDCVRRYTAEYRSENDPIGRWLAECCVVIADSETPSGDLVQNFTRWWELNGDQGRPPTWQHVAKRLTALGCTQSRTRDGRYWRGVEIGQRDAGDACDATSKDFPCARAYGEVSGNGVTRVTRVTDAQNDPKSGASAPPTDPKGSATCLN